MYCKQSMPAACGTWGCRWLWLEPTPNSENLLQKASGLPSQAEFWNPGAGLHNPSGHCFGGPALTPVLPLCISLSSPSLWLLEKVRAFPVSGFVTQESTPSKCLTQCFNLLEAAGFSGQYKEKKEEKKGKDTCDCLLTSICSNLGQMSQSTGQLVAFLH